ncbi:hypothetical protein CKL83_14250 [Bacillus anthracis]|uniref:Uncharacterized protein n=2 Tax=Bacillus anthracis TaxID=1392 RepID=A0A6H3AEI7_BACAN|nr:hypothetical protein [Bacillus anthracis]AAP27015.1 hypothetical protein BA_3222 [Bacillus anthracis str. Ames]AAT32336.1 hypothetical protein GBAA_3222 [Bacillus anthracis str. 'Ames Ancestor']ACP14760.1 hypothetical protein BAMEG_1391 [Bacillus anthracis str. CDC 684]ACQ46620.1 hypothetical protein BAA_3270 [Bacillus anthracis str. A0248]AHE84631.1 hypothetical protein A16R_32900 [Bacillus anthracis str. A16R]AHE90508.1 hypothetical protein A16_32470 [Bacillus anthracis str. A16]EDR2103
MFFLLTGIFYLAICWAVRPPLQNSAEAKKLGGGSTAHKSPIGSTNNQWGMKKTPTD